MFYAFGYKKCNFGNKISDIKPEEVGQNLLAKIKRRDHDAISYNYFRSSIKTIYLLKGLVCYYLNFSLINHS